MIFLRKLLPGPNELKMSTSGGLELRKFSPDAKGFCWEDYYEIVKILFPIRYFIAIVIGDFLGDIWFKISYPFIKFYKWFSAHVIPSKKHHLLDLRQPGLMYTDCDAYSYGWADVPNKMMYAMFNLLQEYLDSDPYDVSEDYSIEEIENDPGMKVQYNVLMEAKAVMHWWKVTRKAKHKKSLEMLNIWSDLRDEGYSIEAQKAFREMNKFDEECDREEEEMLIRLIKIRRNLMS